MELFVPCEPEYETRCALTPESARKLTSLGLTVNVENGLGRQSGYADSLYEEAGAGTTNERGEALASADIILRVRPPEKEAEIRQMKTGALQVSFLDPFNQKDLLEQLKSAKVSAVSMEMMPRTTLAQKMDALSSQANLAGYVAVIEAANRMNRILPMMMTPAGTISPARVFVIGVGVAGLQAIATAKRLGARVEAFDTRPVVEDQVKSLGAKFVKIDLGDTGQSEQGYAKELTPEQIEKQKEGQAAACAHSDIVITTAKLFGRPAPRIIDQSTLDRMKPDSIVVDLAAETGGNVEGSKPGEEVITEKGVIIMGAKNLEGRVAHHASQVYASNLASFVEHFWDTEKKVFDMRVDDEILKGCLLTHEGEIVNERYLQITGGK